MAKLVIELTESNILEAIVSWIKDNTDISDTSCGVFEFHRGLGTMTATYTEDKIGDE